MPIAEDSAGGSPVPVPTDLTTNLTGQATGSGTLDYTTGDIDIVVTVVDNGHNHILDNITDVQVNNAISGQVLKYNGNVWVNGTDENAGITAIVQDLTPQLGGNLDLNNRNITGTGNIAITGTIDGRDVSADGTKLDGIESGATADQTAAQIKTAYESNANTNNFADADVSKLSGIEPGATADQTAAQIKTAYESNSNTNAFTDADHTKLDGIEASADVTDTTNVVASLTAGTNVTIAADGTISATGGSSGLAHVVDDTTPQLGGNLSLNSHDITGTGNIDIAGKLTLESSDPEILLVDTNTNVTTSIDSNSSAGSLQIHVDKGETGSNPRFIVNVGSQDSVLRATTSGLDVTGNITATGTSTFDAIDVSEIEIGDGGGNVATDARNIGSKSSFLLIQRDEAVPIEVWGSRIESRSTHYFGGSNTTAEANIDTSGNITTTGTISSGNLDVTGDIAVSGTVDGVNIAARDAVLTTTTNTADAALPKAGGTMTGDILFNDNVKAKYGTSSDLQIYHDGSNSYISDTGTGDVIVKGQYIRLQDEVGTNLLTADGNDAVSLYYGGASKLATTSTGIDVTGSLTLTGQLQMNGNIIDNVEDIVLKDRLLHHGDSNNYFEFDTDVQYFVTNGSERMRIDSGGIDVTGNIDATRSGGSTLTLENSITSISANELIGGIDFKGNDTSEDGNEVLAFIRANALDTTPDSCIRFGTLQNNGGVDDVVTERMRLDNYGRLGIGSTSPSSLLHLASNAPYITFEDVDNNQDWQIQATAWFAIRDQTANAERMRIDSSGNVGIGTTSPQVKLQTTVANASTEAIRITNDADAVRTHMLPAEIQAHNSNLTLNANDGGFATVIKAGGAERMRIDSGGIDVANGTTYTTTGDFLAKVQQNSNASGKNGLSVMNAWASSTSTIFEAAMGWNGVAAGYYPVFTIDGLGKTTWTDNAGNVRATIDGSGLDVSGGISINSFTPTLTFNDLSATSDYEIEVDQAKMKIKAGTATKLEVNTSGIDVTGDLTVSSTIEVGSLTPNQDGAIEVGVIALGTPAISSTTDSTGLRNHIIFDNPNGAVGKINTLNSSTSYLTSSDYRLKTDVQEMTGSIDRVKALRPVNFEWVVDGTRVDGFLAHEAQEVVPEAVDGEKDAMRDQKYVESEATGDIYTPAVKATYETIQVELTPAVEAVYETVTVEISPAVDAVYETITVEISPAVEATYDDDGNELTPAVEAITEEQEQLVTPAIEAVTEEREQLVTPAVEATYEEQEQELTPAIDEVIHSSDVEKPDELEEGQLWRETTEKVMATRQVPDYQGIDQSKIVPLLTSALQDAIAKIEALETRLEALEA